MISASAPPTIDQFYKFCSKRKLMALECASCGHVMMPPRAICPKCHSSDSSWVELTGNGRLVSYTVIHEAPSQFQHLAPYAVGIVELDEERVRIPGMIKGVKFEEIKVGMRLVVDFEASPATGSTWSRYYFRPAEAGRPGQH